MGKRKGKKTKSHTGLRQTIKQISNEILSRKSFQRGCGRNGPTIIPPIPDSKFIDKLPDGKLKGPNIQEKDHQVAYEAEVKLFRRFEEIQEDCLIIHQLEFTHDQYSAFVNEHQCSKKQCKKRPKVHPCHKQSSEIEGECDFVVAGENFVAVFEVKGLHLQHTEEDERKFEGCCESAILQRDKMKVLIQSIDSAVMFFQFTVFPNIFIDEMQKRYYDDGTLLFADDLENLVSIIDACEQFSSLSTLKRRSMIKCCLLGLWCIDQKGMWDVTSGDLTKCIKDIDEKLRRALVTRKSVDAEKTEKTSGRGKEKAKRKQYPENPEMVEAPKFVKDFLKLSCLTKPQLEAIESKERFLWIEGPAGTGKTTVMFGKMINIVLNEPPERRILVILSGIEHGNKALDHYIKVMGRITSYSVAPYFCDIMRDIILMGNRMKMSDVPDIFAKIKMAHESLSERLSKTEGRIVFLPFYGSFCGPEMYNVIVTFDYVFVDDYQKIAEEVGGHTLRVHFFFTLQTIVQFGLVPVVEKSARNKTSLWVFSDIAQLPCYQYTESSFALGQALNLYRLLKKVFASKILLKDNLRNTFEISAVLSVIRKHLNRINIPLPLVRPLNLPQQKQGHFLRGTKPTIYLLKDDRHAAWRILKDELRKLRGSGSHLVNENIAVTFGLLEGNEMTCTDEITEDDRCVMDWLNTCRDLSRIVDEYESATGDSTKIARDHVCHCSSAEWSASIYIQSYLNPQSIKFSNRVSDQAIPYLYMAVSRARVYSSLIIYGYQRGFYEDTDKLFDELRQRTDVCRVIDR